MKILWASALVLLCGLTGCSKKPVPAHTPEGLASGYHEFVAAVNASGVPNTLYINGQVWSLEEVTGYSDGNAHKDGKSFPGIQAQTNCDARTITYIPEEDPFALRITIWHEIFHAGDCLHGGDTWWNSEHPTAESHPGVVNLSEFTAIFIKMNPLFMRWMEE